MDYKPDFDEACRRLEAWWSHDAIDRAGICVMAPKEGVTAQPPPKASDPQQYWLDPDYVMARSLYGLPLTFFGGEALPKVHVDLGPGILPALLNDKYILQFRTGYIPVGVTDYLDSTCGVTLRAIYAESYVYRLT